MVLLIHHPVSPFSRKVRIAMSEKRMLFVLKEEEPWRLSQDVYKLNPAGELPVYVYDGNVISGNYAICEFLEEVSKDYKLLPAEIQARAEVRRLTEWFDVKFYREVYRNVVVEKVHKRFGQGLAPDSRVLKVGLNNLNFHLEYIDWLAERNNYLAGETFTLADVTAAAHLSVIDYLGDVPWESYMNKKLTLIIFSGLLLSSCSWFSRGEGQVIYHWERENTGVEKFARDHSECMRKAENIRLPDFRTWFYSEEVKLDIRADWHAEKGIWASYIPYPGAMPIVVNSLRDDADSDPKEYRLCMEDKGYWHRTYNLPSVTNIYVYKPQRVLQDVPFNNNDY